MEIESMKSGAAASYQGSAAAASTKTPDTAVQPEASTQAGLSQTADKKPTVQNFFTEKDQENKLEEMLTFFSNEYSLCIST